MHFDETMREKVMETYRKMKGLGIVVAILMIILGGVSFFIPGSGTVILMWLLVVGMLARGISDIVLFCRLPKGARSGWLLAGGIIWAVISLFLIIGDANATWAESLVTWGSFNMVAAFMIGFMSIFGGVMSMCSAGDVRAAGGSGGMCIFSGILDVLVGIICLTYPIGAMITLTMCYGLFLIVGGIALLCSVLAKK